MTNPGKKLNELAHELKCLFIELDDLIDVIMTALIAKQHVMIHGLPGTAKSMIADYIETYIKGIKTFKIQLNGDTLPEEVLGPLNPKDLIETGEFNRKTKNYIPESHLALIDEVFSGNSIVRESVRRVMNERQIFNNGTTIKCPLITMIGGSNDLPDEPNDSILDRFVFRQHVAYLTGRDSITNLLRNMAHEPKTKVTLKDLRDAQEGAINIPIPDDVHESIMNIFMALGDNGGISAVSNRRKKQMAGSTWGGKPFLSVVKAYAMYNGHDTVTKGDLDILSHCLWSRTEEIIPVNDVVVRETDSIRTVLSALRSSIAEFQNVAACSSVSVQAIQDFLADVGESARAIGAASSSGSVKKEASTLISAACVYIRKAMEPNGELARAVAVKQDREGIIKTVENILLAAKK